MKLQMSKPARTKTTMVAAYIIVASMVMLAAWLIQVNWFDPIFGQSQPDAAPKVVFVPAVQPVDVPPTRDDLADIRQLQKGGGVAFTP